MVNLLSTLPNEVAERLTRELSDRDQAIDHLQGEVAHLTEQLAWFKRQMFGRKSERVVDLPPKQPMLDGLELTDETPAPAPEKETITRNKPRQRRGEGGDGISFPADLPVKEIIHELPADEAICLETGEPLQIIGYEESVKLAIKAQEFYLIRHKRAKYAAANNPARGVRCAPMPPCPIERSSADTSLLAHFLIAKYLDHLPLNRLSQIFARDSVSIHRKTMSAWAMQLMEVLRPLYDEMKRRALLSPALFIDETSIKELNPGKCKTRYVWVAVGGGGSDPPYRIYHFGSREYDQLDKFIGDYAGGIHSDQYGAYLKKAQANQIIWQPCGAHARRKFEEASGFSDGFREWILAQFQRVFMLEREAWELAPAERLVLRQRDEAPILDAIVAGCRAELLNKRHVPQAKSRRALEYLLTNAPHMQTYTKHADMRFDNNVAERALRPLALGRKNYQFVGSDRGGEAAAIIYSILQTCKALGVNPQDYLEDVLPRILDHNSNRIGELLPDEWAAARRTANAIQ